MKTSPATVERDRLVATLDELLQPQTFRDYGPNGLQVEGRPWVRKIVTGVTASLALIEAAIEAGADALLVHHGLFWRGQDGRVVGWMKQRLQRVLMTDLNVLAYHLPLDAHPTLGNNAQLAAVLGLAPGLEGVPRFGDQQLGFIYPADTTPAEMAQRVVDRLGRTPVLVGQEQRAVHSVGICTGGAQSYFEAAIAAGVDLFITGEISEPQAHYARECGVAYMACGHHASERYGVQALGRAVAETLGLEHHFIDIDNPA